MNQTCTDESKPRIYQFCWKLHGSNSSGSSPFYLSVQDMGVKLRGNWFNEFETQVHVEPGRQGLVPQTCYQTNYQYLIIIYLCKIINCSLKTIYHLFYPNIIGISSVQCQRPVIQNVNTRINLGHVARETLRMHALVSVPLQRIYRTLMSH